MKKDLELPEIPLFLQSFAVAFPSPLLIATNDSKILYVNESWQDFHHLSLKEVKNKHIYEFPTKSLVKKIYSQILVLKKTHEQSLSKRITYTQKNRATFTIDISIILIKQKRKIAFMLVLYRNVIKKRLTKSKLQVNEQQYRLLFDKNPLPMMIYDPMNFFFVAVNDAAIHHYGYPKKEFLRMTAMDIRPEEDIPALLAFRDKILQSQKNKQLGNAGVWRHLKKNGEIMHVENTWSLIIFKGKPAILILAHDITKQKQDREALEELTRKISHILDSISDGFFSLDNEWKFTYINKQAEKILGGISREEFIGKNIWEVYPHRIGSIYYKKYHEAKEQQEALRFHAPASHNRWLNIHVYPSSNGLSVYFSDITIEKEASRRRDEFISVASHELKTPVTSIKAYAQVLEKHLEKLGDEKSLSHTIKINQQVDRLTRLINDLLDVGRIETGRVKPKKELFRVDEMVREVVESVASSSLSFSIHVPKRSRVNIFADKNMIVQVLTNLLNNAMKYSSERKEIVVRMKKNRKEIIISVEDFGIGIPEDKLKKIFGRFYRVADGNTREVSGLGLGLYISLSIIKEHGGRIWAESEEKKGSTFYFSLPIAQNI